MKVYIGFIILFVKIGFAMPVHYVSTSSITVGEKFTYTVELPVEIAESIQPTFATFEVVKSNRILTPTSTVFEYTLQTFEIDSLKIPTQTIYSINGYPPVELMPITLQLKTMLTATTNQLNDIAAILSLWYINWIIVGIVLLIIVITAGVIFRWVQQKNNSH